ncbi:hypothetical protein CYY_004255 [Polysphondylium violaceum]|uniref:Uncharacterized protein n=1 Tax=Polysphondylium violaceum TaxID=133409 RepID=A0A8J4PVG9_9MYCE|nr:hypothetical protein CYY_004255 [Polysphondylium violaceum]
MEPIIDIDDLTIDEEPTIESSGSEETSTSTQSPLFGILIDQSISLFEKDRLDESLNCVDKAISLDKNSPQGYALRGDINLMIMFPSEALKDYKKALSLDKNNVQLSEYVKWVTDIIEPSKSSIPESLYTLSIDPNNHFSNYSLYYDTQEKKYLDVLEKVNPILYKLSLLNDMDPKQAVEIVLKYIDEEEEKELASPTFDHNPSKKYVVKEINGYKRIIKPQVNDNLDEMYSKAMSLAVAYDLKLAFSIAQRQQKLIINGDIRFYEIFLVVILQDQSIPRQEVFDFLEKFLKFRKDNGSIGLTLIKAGLLMELKRYKEASQLYGNHGAYFILSPLNQFEFRLERTIFITSALKAFHGYIGELQNQHQNIDYSKSTFSSFFTKRETVFIKQFGTPTNHVDLMFILQMFNNHMMAYKELIKDQYTKLSAEDGKDLVEFVENRCDILIWASKCCDDLVIIENEKRNGTKIDNPDYNYADSFKVLIQCYDQLYNETFNN